ncbi:MAG: hypothetical protein QOE41_4038, partial [Mycobacterium sp.]|nr:hypothetical protein [Mycobacterium sp.]
MVTPRSIAGLLDDAAADHPERPLLRDMSGAVLTV